MYQHQLMVNLLEDLSEALWKYWQFRMKYQRMSLKHSGLYQLPTKLQHRLLKWLFLFSILIVFFFQIFWIENASFIDFEMKIWSFEVCFERFFSKIFFELLIHFSTISKLKFWKIMFSLCYKRFRINFKKKFLRITLKIWILWRK